MGNNIALSVGEHTNLEAFLSIEEQSWFSSGEADPIPLAFHIIPVPTCTSFSVLGFSVTMSSSGGGRSRGSRVWPL